MTGSVGSADLDVYRIFFNFLINFPKWIKSLQIIQIQCQKYIYYGYMLQKSAVGRRKGQRRRRPVCGNGRFITFDKYYVKVVKKAVGLKCSCVCVRKSNALGGFRDYVCRRIKMAFECVTFFYACFVFETFLRGSDAEIDLFSVSLGQDDLRQDGRRPLTILFHSRFWLFFRCVVIPHTVMSHIHLKYSNKNWTFQKFSNLYMVNFENDTFVYYMTNTILISKFNF